MITKENQLVDVPNYFPENSAKTMHIKPQKH